MPSLIGLVYGNMFASQMVSFNAACATPIDPCAFRAYHHSTKVRAQNIMVLEEHVSRGEGGGYDMSDLMKFIKRIPAAAPFS